MNIYTKYDYRQILCAVVSERKRLDSTVNFQHMATHVRIPKSYLSKVIHGKADLNSDQLFLVCKFLDFNDQESAYMQLLLEYARTGITARKENLLIEIRQIQTRQLDTKEHIKAVAIGTLSDELTAYYLDPLIQLTHICLSIPRYQKDQNLLAHDLRVPVSKLLTAINKLEQMRVISRTKDGIRLDLENIHLPKNSPVYKSWRNQLKLKAMSRVDSIPEENVYSFSVVFSSHEEIRKEIHSRFLSFLKGIEELVRSGPQEDAYQMSFELFSWTKD